MFFVGFKFVKFILYLVFNIFRSIFFRKKAFELNDCHKDRGFMISFKDKIKWKVLFGMVFLKFWLRGKKEIFCSVCINESMKINKIKVTLPYIKLSLYKFNALGDKNKELGAG